MTFLVVTIAPASQSTYDGWNEFASFIDDASFDCGAFSWNEGRNMNHQVRIVPGKEAMATIMDDSSFLSHLGHQYTADVNAQFLVFGSVRRTRSITKARVLVGYSWNGMIKA